jgi:hypothetical protein
VCVRCRLLLQGTAGGFAVQFAAAKDHQESIDTSIFSGNVNTGAFTHCFIKAIERRGLKLT